MFRVYVCVQIYTHISNLCRLKGPRSNDTSVGMSTTRTQTLVGETGLIPGWEEEKYKMILDHLFVPKSKEAPKNDGNMSKRHKN